MRPQGLNEPAGETLEPPETPRVLGMAISCNRSSFVLGVMIRRNIYFISILQIMK